MATYLLRRYTGCAALVAGGIEILGVICLILFFALELPQGRGSALRFGFLSDLLPIIAAPAFLVVVILVFLIQRKEAPEWSAIAALLGTAGILLTAWTNIKFISETITLEQQIQLFYVSLALLGPWHILVNFLAQQEVLLPSRLTTFGLLVGVSQVIMFILSFVLGGYDDMLASDSTAIRTNIPLLISLAIGIPMALLGYFSAPIWLVWLGRVFVRGNSGMPTLHSRQTGSEELI